MEYELSLIRALASWGDIHESGYDEYERASKVGEDVTCHFKMNQKMGIDSY